MLRLRTLAALLIMSVVLSRVHAEGRATIVGSWRVVSYDIEFQNSGERRPLLGGQPHGYLIFTPQGRVMSYLEAEGRTVPTTDEECVEGTQRSSPTPGNIVSKGTSGSRASMARGISNLSAPNRSACSN